MSDAVSPCHSGTAVHTEADEANITIGSPGDIRTSGSEGAEPAGLTTGSRRVGSAFAAITGFGVLFFLMLGRPVARSDEAWMLWVMHRVLHGGVLYRDV